MASTALGFGTFRAPVNYEVGGNPLDVAVGDVNLDGNPDLATADDDGISVLRGRADGTFRSALVYPIVQPNYFAIGRLDGDDIPDLAIVGGPSDELSIALGNGNGTFQPSTDPDYTLSGDYPYAIAIGDLDRDGVPDLVAGTSSSSAESELWVLMGNGDGTFQHGADYEFNASVYTVAIATFHGDRRPDLAVTDGSACAVGVMEGNGDGTFTPPVDHDHPLGSCPYAVIAGQFVGDDRTDLATASRSGTMSVLRARDDADFGAADTYDVGTTEGGAEPFDLVARDLNRDGRIDFALPDRQNDVVALLRAKADGGFRQIPDERAGEWPISIVAGRFDGDRGPDLATSNQVGEDVSVLLNRP